MKKMILGLAVMFAAGMISRDIRAASPPFVPLQGFLEDAAGAPVNGDVNIHFAVYDSEVGGFTLWYETQNIHVEEGVFAAYLGEVEALDLSLFRDNTNLWLGIQVESDPEMGRVYLASTPFTGYAEYCGNIPDHGHDFSQITGTDAVVVGAQSCTGSDKVVGVDISGALVCAADEDTTYDGSIFALSGQACTGTAKVSGIDASGALVCMADDDTTYLAGMGLLLTGATFSVDTTVIQRRVAGACSAHTFITAVRADGTVNCSGDADLLDGLDSSDFMRADAAVVPRGATYSLVVNAASRGMSDTGSKNGVWINGSNVHTGVRSYNLVVIRRSDGVVIHSSGYDVYGDPAQATALASDLATFGRDSIIILYGHDEPQTNRLLGSLPDQVKRCGGSAQVFEGASFMYRSAYVLVGICDSGEGTGIELYSGDIDSDTTAFVDMGFLVIDGNLVR